MKDKIGGQVDLVGLESSKTISIQVSAELYQYVKGEASAERRSMSNWIRLLIEAQREVQPSQISPSDYSRLYPQFVREGE